MAAGYQQRLCHLNITNRCVPIEQNILDDFFEKSLDNWYTSFYIILNPYQTDRKYMNLGKRRTT